MLPMEVLKVRADVVVAGAGGAACRAAVSARREGAVVRLVTKAPLRTGGSTVHGASEIMSVGAAGFGDPRDSPEVHFQDTMRAGRGFVDPVLVRVLAEDAPARIKDLIALGVPFDRDENGDFKLIRSDFGSYARGLGVGGKTGRVIVNALSAELLRLGVEVDATVALVDLIRDRDGTVAGALGYDAERQSLVHYEAPSVILGTGGIHGAFEQQVSTAELTGDGQAICFRHGAEMVNLEFHQFGPALIHPYVQLFSGSCFRLHPELLNARGDRFLSTYVPKGVDLREVYDQKVFTFTTSNVSRYIDIAIAREISAARGTLRGGVYFSFAHVPQEKFHAVMPNTTRWLLEHRLDPRRDRLEVGIAFQCMNGGVRMTGTDAQSTIPGLFVIGELAGGVRGPDRPGGNSLAEGQVFGHRSGIAAARQASKRKVGDAYTLDETIEFLATLTAGNRRGENVAELSHELRSTMQRNCLVEKSAKGLSAALEVILHVKEELDRNLALSAETIVAGLNTRNLAQVSELILLGCLNRNETRGAHCRVDHPVRDDESYLHSVVLRRKGNEISLSNHQY